MIRTVTAMLVCCFVAGVSLKPASATLVTYNFSGIVTVGPFSGESLTGSLSFDDSIGQGVTAVLDPVLPDLSIQIGTLNPLTFDETTAAARFLFFSGGTLTDFTIGGRENGLLSVIPFSDDFLLHPGGDLFRYSTENSSVVFDSPGLSSFSLAQVPEPGTLPLFGIALLGLLELYRRRLRAGWMRQAHAGSDGGMISLEADCSKEPSQHPGVGLDERRIHDHIQTDHRAVGPSQLGVRSVDLDCRRTYSSYSGSGRWREI